MGRTPCEDRIGGMHIQAKEHQTLLANDQKLGEGKEIFQREHSPALILILDF